MKGLQTDPESADFPKRRVTVCNPRVAEESTSWGGKGRRKAAYAREQCGDPSHEKGKRPKARRGPRDG